jgi:hypothetical protein
MACLAAERAELLWQILGADDRALGESIIFEQGDWTVKDILAHVAAWDHWEHRMMAAMLTGDQPDFSALEEMDAFNAAAVAEWRDRSLGDVLAELQDARASWLTWLDQLPRDGFFQSRPFQGWDWRFPNCLEVQWQHDAEHARQIGAWRKRNVHEGSNGPSVALLAALHAARDELLTAAALAPVEERTSRRVCGEWTLKDVLGHVADWEQVGVEGLRDMAAGSMPQCEHITDIESWNRAHAAERRDEPWEDAWMDLHRVRDELDAVLEGMTDEALRHVHRFPWGPRGTAYQWVRVFIRHDREHAESLRIAMGVHSERSGPG